jgi:apolipoprotein N-acyltransferase
LLLQAKINPLRLIGLAFISSILLWLAWPPMRFGFVLFIAFVPILAVEDHISRFYRRKSWWILLIGYFTFLLWNVFTTYWIWFASPAGSIFAICANSLLMTIPFLLYHGVKRSAGRKWGYVSLICFWLCLEMLHLNWDAPWPWLNLGNAFATLRDWVQWYEYTGTLGATVWVWIINILIYESYIKASQPKDEPVPGKNYRLPAIALAIIVLPIVISYIIKPKDIAPKGSANVVAVQPNIDPYNDKFDTATYASQISTLIKLSEKTMDSNTIILAWPETAIAEDVNEERLLSNHHVNRVHDFLMKHPKVKLITGISSSTVYPLQMHHTNTARMFPDKSAWYDVFNTALELDHTDRFSIYHKSKLVPGVEKMPYPAALSFLERFSIDEGGSSGSLGSQDTPTIFNINDTIIAAPVICYESIFGDHVRGFVKKGADIITIITNDGWWKNSPGYMQHLYFGALRAIETRRFIVRSANTGVSCFVLPSGEMVQMTNYWEPAAIKSTIYINHGITFYTRHGDYIGWAGVWLSGIFFLFILVSAFWRKKQIK